MTILNLPSVPYMVCGGIPRTDLLMPYWEGAKVPPVPVHPIIFSEDSSDWFKFLCECISLAKRAGELHLCSSFALNRRIQNAYKSIPLKIDFAEYLTRAWRHAGVEALAAMASFPPIVEGDYWSFEGYERGYSRIAFTESAEPMADNCYHAIEYYQRCRAGQEGPPKYWTVVAEDYFGRYRMCMVSDSAPELHSAQDICQWEYRLPIS